MKSCPKCNRTYSDETLSYCLVDGAVLSAPYDPNQTLQLPEPRTTDPPVDKPLLLSTITAVQAPLHAQKPPPREERKGSKPWLVIALGLTTVSLLVVAVVLGFVLSRQSGEDNQSNSNTSPSPNETAQVTVTPTPTSTNNPTPRATDSPTPRVTPTTTPQATPTPTAAPTVAKPAWARHDNTSINEGTRITFYAATTPEQCRSDCQRNPACRAATYIRQGAYNPGDAPMCYLMSAIKTLNPSTCCISFIRQQ